MAWRDLAHLLLVGGATRMPMIANMVETLTGLKPVANIHADEAVARGAVLYAEQLLAAREGRASAVRFDITELTSHSLGVEWRDPGNGRAENVVLIPRGTELPCGTTSKVVTQTDDQTSIELNIARRRKPRRRRMLADRAASKSADCRTSCRQHGRST